MSWGPTGGQQTKVQISEFINSHSFACTHASMYTHGVLQQQNVWQLNAGFCNAPCVALAVLC